MKVLVIGAGGREHALAWKISQSHLVDQVYCAPGNGGTVSIAQNIPIKADDLPGLLKFALEERIQLTVVGPEQPLAAGIVDLFHSAGLKIFGPTKAAAEIESSKVFCRNVLKDAGVPQPSFRVFDDHSLAEQWVREQGVPIVIKADGLAAGKGVTVAESIDDAILVIQKIMHEKVFGAAGNQILIEEKLNGQEASFHCFVDGENVVPLVASQDHKRVGEGDTGPNTGGMGAYSPTPVLSAEQEQTVVETIIKPTVVALKKMGRQFTGMLYAGLMINEQGIFVIEFNCRFGDPETQVIIPRMVTDIMVPLNACVNGTLGTVKLEWKKSVAACVVLASGGYPGSYETGKRIVGLNIAKSMPNTLIFHAGTKMLQGTIMTTGGRVLNVVGVGDTLSVALNAAYTSIRRMSFEGMFFRKDIGFRVLQEAITND
jgi:phosphoribosylamine---glycine ligase